MANLSDLQLEQSSHSALVMMVRFLLVRVESLEKEIQILREEIERLKRPKPNLRNSSQPPSRDQKPDSSKDQPGKKHGPPFGHKRLVRPLVENPDKIIIVDVDQCASCNHDLTGTEPSKVVRRQVTELPEIKPIVLETQQTEKTCSHCHHLNRAELPAGLEADRFFGPHLEATIVFLKHQNHFSYGRIVNALREVFGLKISEGGMSTIIACAGNLASAQAAEIREAVKSSSVIQSDETSARVKGRNYWHWVFLSESGAYHQIVPRRNAEVIRDLKRILERLPESAWTTRMRKLFREPIHLNNRMISPSAHLPLNGFHRSVSEIGNCLDRLLVDQLTDSDEIRLQNRFRLHREKLLTFPDYPGVPSTNNASEQDIRTSVIHRKVTNGCRSEVGVRRPMWNLLSVISALKIKGKRVFETLVNLMRAEVLPFLYSYPP